MKQNYSDLEPLVRVAVLALLARSGVDAGKTAQFMQALHQGSPMVAKRFKLLVDNARSEGDTLTPEDTAVIGEVLCALDERASGHPGPRARFEQRRLFLLGVEEAQILDAIQERTGENYSEIVRRAIRTLTE